MRLLVSLLSLLLLAGCDFSRFRNHLVEPPISYQKVWGWKPIFSSDTSHKTIYYTEGAEPNKRPGNIYIYKQWILQSEIGKGVHIIDRTDPENAVKIGFIHIAGNTDLSIKDNILYANNYYDLISVNIENLSAPVLLSRHKGMFYTQDSRKPFIWQLPDSAGYYDCGDFRLRDPDYPVIGWQRDSVLNGCLKN